VAAWQLVFSACNKTLAASFGMAWHRRLGVGAAQRHGGAGMAYSSHNGGGVITASNNARWQ